MRMLSIDPGTRGCGVALFQDGQLVRAAYVPNSAKQGSGPRECATMAEEVVDWVIDNPQNEARVDMISLEVPQIYTRDKSKGDPNKLMPLFGVDAAIAALIPEAKVEWNVPRDWKGNVSKPKSAKEPYAITDRVMARLEGLEVSTIYWQSDDTDAARKRNWDIADAIGIGLAALGRFARHRTFARE